MGLRPAFSRLRKVIFEAEAKAKTKDSGPQGQNQEKPRPNHCSSRPSLWSPSMYITWCVCTIGSSWIILSE